MATITSVDVVNDVKAVLHDVELLLQQAGAAGGAQARELRERAEAGLSKMQAKLHDRPILGGGRRKGRSRGNERLGTRTSMAASVSRSGC